MLLYVFYRVRGFGGSSSAIIESGYSLLFDLPRHATVDVFTLVAQWIGVVLVGAIGFVLLKDR